ncbi:MAG: ras guanine nucleotide exchange factor domain-containing protein [Benniella sp.]|nr:MAG: ras guanine nucleotide exchange factor domain-containing protein [Benniella sp.]
MVEGHLHVVAGLLEKLIERLADQNTQDSEYLSCFLLSHSFFIDSEDLLDRLIARFHIQPRQGETMYYQKWQRVIKCKVLCALERWIKIQFEDFELNSNLLKTLKKFLEVDAHQGGFAFEAGCILEEVNIRCLSPKKNCSAIMEQNRFCLQRSRTRKISLSKSQNRRLSGRLPGSPGPLSPSATEMIPATPASGASMMIEYAPAPELATVSPILHLSALELARYLTLADMKAFRSITVFELMSGWWKRRQAQENRSLDATTDDDATRSMSGLSVDADNADDGAIEAFTRRANMLSYWVAHEIVSIAGSKPRKQLIKKFIEVAKTCRELNNLHTCMFIISALTSTPVRRLSATWKLVSSKDMETLRQLEKLLDISGNMRYYRQAFEEAEAPAIPFLPILLKDITFILDGNPTKIPSRINASGQQQRPPVSSSSQHDSSSSGDSDCIETAGVAAESGEGSSVSQPQPPVASQPPVEPQQQDNGSASGPQLINFDKFRRLTLYVEHVVDMAKSADYWFEPQLLRQARVFRPSSPNPSPSQGSGSQRGGHQPVHNGSSTTLPFDGPRAPLDDISEVVERRLVKASGLYGVHQRVVEVEFTTTTKPKSTSLWKGGVVSTVASGVGSSLTGAVGAYGPGPGSGSGSGPSSSSVQGSTAGETVIRAVQGEEEYLMGLSLMCEPGR